MQHATIAGLARPVPRLILGTMIISDDDQARSDDLLDAAVGQGITAFDTARVYGGGHSEVGLGRWIARRGGREQIQVFSKGCHPAGDQQRVTPADFRADVEASRASLGLDHIDGYLLHRDDLSQPIGPLVEAASACIDDGLIGCWGGSNWRHERLQAAIDYAAAHGLHAPACSSPNYSLADQVADPWGPGCVGIGGSDQAETRAWYRAAGMPVLAYSSLARGLFSGRVSRAAFAADPTIVDRACATAYCHPVNFDRLERLGELARQRGVSVAQLALAWLLHQPEQVHALVGAATADEIAATAAAVDIRLEQETCRWLVDGD